MTRSAAWILLVSLAAPATAQDHFGQLIDVIEPGDDIRVALTGDGVVRAAQLVGLTPRMLSVRIDGRRLDLGRDDVLTVRYGVDDSTVDGFWRGFAGGLGSLAGLTFWICSITRDCAPNQAGFYAGFLLVGSVYGVAGGVIGVIVDRAHQAEARWPDKPRRAWSVGPLLTPDRRGVAVSLDFRPWNL